MANGNIVIPVGVELELKNIQDIISSLQKAMSNVKPETKGYSAIVSELTKAEKRVDSLTSKLKQGFSTEAGIKSFTKGFEDLVAIVDTVNNKVSQISFDSLILTKDQQSQMENFTKQIQAAKDAYNTIETDKIKEAVKNSQSLKAVFDKLKINVDATSLDNVIKTIRTKVDELQRDIDSSEKKAANKEILVSRRQSEMDELVALKKSVKNGTLTQDYSQFFDKNGNFKSGGKQSFVSLLEQLGLDDATVEKVKQTAGTKIQEIQQEIQDAIDKAYKKKNRSRIDAQNAVNEAKADVAAKTKEQSDYSTAQTQTEDIQKDKEIIDAKKAEAEAIDKATAARSAYQNTVLKNAKGDSGADAANELANALDRVRASGGAAAIELENLNSRDKTISNIKNTVAMWMGFNQILRLSRIAIKNIVKDIRELDKVMTQIAVVTNMSQADLWNQMSTYQNMAKQYGVATSGVYQVSQIYYQQGLQTSDVMALTNETLKMAKIAGLDYSKAADYMTVAIRGFKMEMTDAQRVVDVYSNLAAKSASDTTELATAMSKTASSAEAVGSSFENTSAMIAMMVETTRESAENIGSALKSIISRYGEMSSDPSKLVDSEGEALSLNKVDKALQSVGISLHDAQGQFRDFDDVILELSSKWQDLDKNSQRYYKVA